MSKAKSTPSFPFKLAETVVEPTIGICTVVGMRRMTVDGIEEDYYIFQAGNAKVMVPRSQLPKRGIRRPMTKDEVKRIFALLKTPVSPNRDDARMQYTNYRDIMKSGDPQKISRLLRDLYTLDQIDELKGKEKEIMEQAKKFLCDEITFIRSASKTQVMESINEALRQMYKKKIQRDKEKSKKSSSTYPAFGEDEALDESGEAEEETFENGEEGDDDSAGEESDEK